MATSNRAAWVEFQSKLMAAHHSQNVVIGEPRKGNQDGTIAVIPLDGGWDETVLTQPREIHRVNFRMYKNWLSEPQENIEFELDKFRADIMADMAGDFDIGGNVAYLIPDEFGWEFDEAEVSDTLYRVINLTIAYRVDARATFVK